MATSGSFNTNAYDVRYLTFNWSVVSQSVANNQTTISWNLVGAGGSPSTWYMSGNFKVVIDGVVVYSSATRIQLKSGTVVASGNYTFTHNIYGDKSFSASAEAGIYTVDVNCSGSGSWSLPQIPRFATMTSANNFNDMQNPSFSYNNPRNLTMTAWLEVNPVGDVVARRILNLSTSGTYTWDLTEEERNELRSKIPNSKTAICRIGILTTIGDTTRPSYKDVTFTIVEKKPTFDVSYKDINSTTTNITGNNQLIIRNNSILEIDVTNAVAYKSATLSSVSVNINGVIYNENLDEGTATFNIGEINVSDDITAVVTLIDSRGFTAIKNVNISVLDWVLPTAIINLQRENNFYSETNINVNADYSSLDNKNTISIKMRYKKVSDSSWGSYINLQDDVTIQETLDNNFAWDFQVVLQDKLGTTTYNLILDRGIPIAFFDRLKRSLGVNCFPSDAESLEVNGKTIADIIYPVGSIYLSVNNTNPATLFGGNWEQIKDRFLLSAGDTYTGGSIGGSSNAQANVELFSVNSNIYLDYQSSGTTATYKADNRLYSYGGGGSQSLSENQNAGIKVTNVEDTTKLMPPYLAVYVWKRIS